MKHQTITPVTGNNTEYMPGRASIEKFDYKKSEQYILSIRLSADGFSFVVYNPQHYCFLLSVTRKPDNSISLPANLKLAFRELTFLSYPYKKVYILVVDKRYTFIPIEIFEEAHLQELFCYNFSKKDNELIYQNTLVGNNCEVAYGIDKNHYTVISEKYPNNKCFSHSTILTEFFSAKSRSLPSKQMFACLRDSYVDLFCFNHGRILLVNSYGECKVAMDYSYYILFVWKQLGMDQLNDELYILGESSQKKELLETMKNFIENIFEFEVEAELGNFYSEDVATVSHDIQIFMSQVR